ncbi:hypothetical protein GCM10028864_36030 [Microlunatus parietis]
MTFPRDGQASGPSGDERWGFAVRLRLHVYATAAFRLYVECTSGDGVQGTAICGPMLTRWCAS